MNGFLVEKMNDNKNNNQIILRCECPYCQSFLNDHVNKKTAKNERSDKVKDCAKEFVLYNVKTNQPITVGGEEVVLNHCLYEPKKELRGVWVTTVRNTDFPTLKVFEGGIFNLELFKKQYMNILDYCKELNLNAVFVQIRPEGDAFYPSVLNPLSEYLTGKQGLDNGLNGFDPLEWMIEVTHCVGIEFHAWFNPYRITPSTKRNLTKEELFETLANSNYAKKFPEQTYFFNGQLFLNPGIPTVNQYVLQSIMEVVENYQIDAVHLDDYFYPYPYETEENGEVKFHTFSDSGLDQSTYEKYNKGNQSIEKWREENINKLVKSISKAIERYNHNSGKSIAFGISPFGVWAAAEQTNGVGSNTSINQLASLDEYVNSKLWIDEGWLDYIVPQNYWSFADELSSFGDVASWWDNLVAGKDVALYMGLGIYLYDEDQDNPAWQNPDEIRNQILYGRLLPNNDGYVFFTYNSLLEHTDSQMKGEKILDEAVSEMKQTVLAHKALIPPREWLQTTQTHPIAKMKVKQQDGELIIVFEDTPNNNSEYYAIYRVEGEGKNIILRDELYLIDVIGKNTKQKQQRFVDQSANPSQIYTYGISAISQAQVESKLMKLIYHASIK